ncbi:MAG: hypothetical protein ACREMI_03520 [Gemmatimonadales bacterium]
MKLAGVIVAYLLMSSRTPNADIAPWIRRWTRTASGIAGLAALWVNAESRYHRAHGSYSDDIAELRRLGSSLIDSLVVVAVDARRYRAIATDPGGRVSCGLWSAARIGERTPLQIEGAGAGELVCWTPSDSAKKAAR